MRNFRLSVRATALLSAAAAAYRLSVRITITTRTRETLHAPGAHRYFQSNKRTHREHTQTYVCTAKSNLRKAEPHSKRRARAQGETNFIHFSCRPYKLGGNSVAQVNVKSFDRFFGIRNCPSFKSTHHSDDKASCRVTCGRGLRTRWVRTTFK